MVAFAGWRVGGGLIAVGALLLGCGEGEDGGAEKLPPVTASCEAMQGQLAVDGAMSRTFAAPASLGVSAYLPNSDRWMLNLDLTRPAFLQLSGAGAMQPNGTLQPLEGNKLSIERALFAPDVNDGGLGTMYAVAPGSGSFLSRQGDQLLVDLRQATTLQGCGDHPIAGEINLCFEADIFTPCPDGASGGMVGSTPFKTAVGDFAGGLGRMTASLFSDAIEMRGQTTSSGTGPITWALIRTNVTGPFQGKVLCAGSGSQVTTMPSGIEQPHEIWQFRNLGVLEGTGKSRVTGCLR